MRKTIFSVLLPLCFLSCQKEAVQNKVDFPPVEQTPAFSKYIIAAGQHYSDKNIYVQTSFTELNFIAKFDSTAIYTTSEPNNQYDINKLFGFSDNSSSHHLFSARFGWRWSDNALRLFGYVYNNGVRDSKELGTVRIGAENNCSLKVTPSDYIFSLNGITDSLPRMSTTVKAEGYKLYPYFGGDEKAPHEISIYIRESN